MPDSQIGLVVRMLGAVKSDYEGTEFYTLTVRLADGTAGDLSGIGTFDFSEFLDKDVMLSLEMRKSNGRFKIRAVSAEEVK